MKALTSQGVPIHVDGSEEGDLIQWILNQSAGAGATGQPGVTGAAGVTGSAGATGSPGATGPAGITGPAGVTGAPGVTGSPGVTGTAGAQGSPGSTGPAGAQGATGMAGVTGSPGVTGAAGSGAVLCIPLVSDAAGLTLTNMALALNFFNASHRYALKADLTNFTQVRLIVNKQGTAGAAASKIILRYRTAFDATAANWSDIGTSEVSCAINVQNTVIASSWISLAAGAQADVFICPLMSGGDGALDPVIGSIVAQFK